MKTIKFIFFVSVVLFTKSQASDSSIARTKLDPITVSGSGLKQKLSKTVSAVTVFSEEEIKSSGAKSLADFLQGRSSVEIGRNGGYGATTSFFLRGSESRNVLVLLNGVRLRDELTQSSLAENISLDVVERIEVILGNISSIYGEGAVGGVIKIFTKKSEPSDKKLITALKIETGNYNSQNYSLAGNYTPTDGTKIGVFLSNFKSGGFSSTNPKQTFSLDPSDSDNDQYSNKSINIDISSELGNGTGSLNYYSSHSNTMFDNSFFGTDPRQATKQEMYNVIYKTELLENVTTEFSFDDSTIGLTYNYGQFFSTKQSQFNFKNSFRLSEKDELLLGFESRTMKRNPASSGVTKRKSNAYYMAYLKNVDFLDIQANLRNDSTSLFGNETTYLLGAKYNQTEKLSYYFNKSTAFITPNTYAISTNASVLPEQHDQYELGLTFFDDFVFFRVGYFDTDTKNPITYDPEDSYKAKNFSFMQNQGMEIQGKIYRGNHTFDYSLTFQNPRTPSGLNPKVMTQSARRSKFYGSFGYAITMNKYTFSLRATVSGKRRDSDYNNIDLEKYLSVNGTLNYQFLPLVNVFASVQNISNSRHQLAYGYNTIPRLLMMGFKVNY